MQKMMSSKEQDKRHLSDALDRWFQRNFGDVADTDPMYPRLLAAKDDARKIFGLDQLIKGEGFHDEQHS
jgi:hypothetical protein